MDKVQKDFLKRQKAIKRKHRRLADGYVTRVNRAGVIEHRPRRSVMRFTAMPLVVLLALLFGFKVMLLSQLGEEAYLTHVDALESGNVAERLGAIIMRIDPATERVTGLIQPYL